MEQVSDDLLRVGGLSEILRRTHRLGRPALPTQKVSPKPTMDPSSIIAAVCIMGRTSTPLYFRVFTEANPLDMELIVYSSLDTLDEKFLGLLLHVEEYKVFGYATSTSTRIIVVVKDVLLSVASVKDMFSRLHKAYADAAASPFTVSMDAPMSSPSFHATISSVVKEAGAALLFSA